MRLWVALAGVLSLSACGDAAFRTSHTSAPGTSAPTVSRGLIPPGSPGAPQVRATPGNPPEPLLTGPGIVDPAVTPPVPAGTMDRMDRAAQSATPAVLSATRLTIEVDGTVPCSGMRGVGDSCLLVTMPTGEKERIDGGIIGYDNRGTRERIVVEEQRLDLPVDLLPGEQSPIRYVYISHATPV